MKYLNTSFNVHLFINYKLHIFSSRVIFHVFSNKVIYISKNFSFFFSFFINFNEQRCIFEYTKMNYHVSIYLQNKSLRLVNKRISKTKKKIIKRSKIYYVSLFFNHFLQYFRLRVVICCPKSTRYFLSTICSLGTQERTFHKIKKRK